MESQEISRNPKRSQDKHGHEGREIRQQVGRQLTGLWSIGAVAASGILNPDLQCSSRDTRCMMMIVMIMMISIIFMIIYDDANDKKSQMSTLDKIIFRRE